MDLAPVSTSKVAQSRSLILGMPDNRLGAAEFTVPPRTNGPPPHWHEMHDETFLVTKGTLRFFTTGLKDPLPDIDAKVGDYVTVPTRAPHTFGNPFDEEAKFFNTFTPAFYINYFKLLANMAKEGPVGPPQVMQAMAAYATLPVKSSSNAGVDK